MSTKIRMQLGETVVSWGLVPELPAANAPVLERGAHPARFAVIEGGHQCSLVASQVLPLRAQFA